MIQFSHYVSDRFVLFSLTQGDTASDNEEYGDVVVNETEDDETGDDETGDDETGDEVNEKEDDTESVLGSESTNPIFGPFRKFSRENELSGYQQELKMVQGKKIICSLDLLLAVFKARCQTPGCTVVPTVQYYFVGVAIIIKSSCSAGHTHKFCSSHQTNEVYANNLQVVTSIMVSGNQFAKIERMARFLHLQFMSKSTYYRFQRLYVVPGINEWWMWMKQELVTEFSGQDVVVRGDGQCDSPVFNAKNICYFVMEVTSNYILDIEVLDKRHVGLISTNMEKEAAQRSLDRLKQELKIVEFVTDASTSVIALL